MADAAAAHCVRREEFAQDLENTWTQGGGVFEKLYLKQGKLGSTPFVNYKKTEFDSDPSGYLTSEEDRYDFERGTPRVRGIFSVKHAFADLTVQARANYYGSYYNSDATGGVIYAVQKFDPEWFFDLELSYPITELVTMTVGARNIFDNYPQKSDYDACCGRVYSSDTIVDWQGGYYYLRFSAAF